MSKQKLVTLIKQTYSKDAIGQNVPVETRRELFCTTKSIRASEFFEAGKEGLRPAFCIKIYDFEYEGEEIAEIDGKRYGIYRSYLANGEKIELYLTLKSGV